MPLVGSALAAAMAAKLGKPVTPQLLGWGNGIVLELQTGAIVSHSTGTVIGQSAPGSPLSQGAASGGSISGISGSTMASLVVANSSGTYPVVTPQLLGLCTEIANHIISEASVDFASGNITGNCTNTPLSPGPLVNGAGSNGEISGLDGDSLANDAAFGVPFIPPIATPDLKDFCNAIIDYIMNNANVIYPPNSIIAVCPPGGGPITGGTGTGGKIL